MKIHANSIPCLKSGVDFSLQMYQKMFTIMTNKHNNTRLDSSKIKSLKHFYDLYTHMPARKWLI